MLCSFSVSSSEWGSGAPGHSDSLGTKLTWLEERMRNRKQPYIADDTTEDSATSFRRLSHHTGYILTKRNEKPAWGAVDSSPRQLRGLGSVTGPWPDTHFQELQAQKAGGAVAVGRPRAAPRDVRGHASAQPPPQGSYLFPKGLLFRLTLLEFWEISLRPEEKMYSSQLLPPSMYMNSLWRFNRVKCLSCFTSLWFLKNCICF